MFTIGVFLLGCGVGAAGFFGLILYLARRQCRRKGTDPKYPNGIVGFCVACEHSKWFPTLADSRREMFAHTAKCPEHPLCKAFQQIDDLVAEVERLNDALNKNAGYGV